MTKLTKFLTLLIGLATIIFTYQLIAGFAFLGGKFNLMSSLRFMLVSIILQSGFLLSPFVIKKNAFIKISVLLLMVPFAYYFIFHDLKAIYLYMLPFNNAVQDWKFNFWSNFMSILLCFIWLIGYSYNGIRLLLSIPYRNDETENLAKINLS